MEPNSADGSGDNEVTATSDSDGPITEDDLTTFEGWLRFQRFDATTATPDELKLWRRLFDQEQKKAALKVGLMKLPPCAGTQWRSAMVLISG